MAPLYRKDGGNAEFDADRPDGLCRDSGADGRRCRHGAGGVRASELSGVPSAFIYIKFLGASHLKAADP